MSDQETNDQRDFNQFFEAFGDKAQKYWDYGITFEDALDHYKSCHGGNDWAWKFLDFLNKCEKVTPDAE